MRTCPDCKKDAVINDGYCGICRQCTLESETARPDGAAFACSDWLAELGAALSTVQKLRDTAGSGKHQASRNLLSCAEQDLRAVLNQERRRSASVGDQRQIPAGKASKE